MLAQIATCWYTPTLRRFRRILRCVFDARGLGYEPQSAAGEEYINGRRAEQGMRHVSNSRDHHRVRAFGRCSAGSVCLVTDCWRDSKRDSCPPRCDVLYLAEPISRRRQPHVRMQVGDTRVTPPAAASRPTGFVRWWLCWVVMQWASCGGEVGGVVGELQPVAGCEVRGIGTKDRY